MSIFSTSSGCIASMMTRPTLRWILFLATCVCFSLMGQGTYFVVSFAYAVNDNNRTTTSDYRLDDSYLNEFVNVSDEAAALPKKGKILCWLLTSEKYHDTRAQAVNETWLGRCDHGVFFTNAPFKKDKKIPYRTVFAEIPDLYSNLFFKTRYALYYISEVLQADFDWYVKADDDAYIVMENLRAYLDTLDPTKPYYLGHRMKPYLEKGYNSGGGGYVLSRKALELFAWNAYNNASICPVDGFEDVGIGRCFANLGIFPHSTVNERGQQRFNAYHPRLTLEGWEGHTDWIYDPLITGFDGIAEDLISFHHLSPMEIRLFDMLLYRVKIATNTTYRKER